MNEIDEARLLEIMKGIGLDLANFEVTENPIFLWSIIKAMTQPALDGKPVPLPAVARRYLNGIADIITDAALRPAGAFLETSYSALKLKGGASGKSKAEEYAKRQSTGLLLAVYIELQHRHGADQAYRLMSEALNIGIKAINIRMTEARAHEKKLVALGIVPALESGRPYQGLPDQILLQTILKGLPDIFWIHGAGKKLVDSATPAKGKRETKKAF